MARPTIAQIRTIANDFQKVYYWQLNVLKAPAAFPIAGADLNLRCTSTDIPKYRGETAVFRMKGYQILDPGIYVAESTITLRFIEFTDSLIRTAWDAWIDACNKKPVTFQALYGNFQLLTTDNQNAQDYDYTLSYCFPDATQPSDLGSDDSDPYRFSVSLRYIDVQPTGIAPN